MGTVIKSERTRPFMPEIDILKLCIWERMNLFERRSTRRIPTGIEWGFQLAFDTYTGPRACARVRAQVSHYNYCHY